MTLHTYFSQYGIDEAGLRLYLATALSRGAHEADLFLEHTVTTRVEVKAGALSSTSIAEDLGVGVRTFSLDIADSGEGFAFAEGLEPLDVQTAAELAAQAGPQSSTIQPVSGLHLPRRRGMRCSPLPRQSYAPDAQVQLLEQISRKLAEVGYVKHVGLTLLAQERHVMTARSVDGLVVEDYRPIFTVIAQVTYAEDDKAAATTITWSSPVAEHLDSAGEYVVKQAVERGELLLAAGPAPAGDLPVVLMPAAAAVLLHEAVGHALEADLVLAGRSPYSRARLGELVASPLVTLEDDGGGRDRRGTLRVDDEGEDIHSTLLIENGLLRGYITDRRTEHAMGDYNGDSTGNGRRESFRHPPLPRMTILRLREGGTNPTRMLDGITRGVLVAAVAGGEAALGQGDFAFQVEYGWLIENGAATTPIRGFTIRGNGPQVLRDIDVVGDDCKEDQGAGLCGKGGQTVQVGQASPTIRVRSLTVGGV
jgi:TldD protein